MDPETSTVIDLGEVDTEVRGAPDLSTPGMDHIWYDSLADEITL